MAAKKNGTSRASITTTKNYRLFTIDDANRDLNIGKRKRLRNSVAKYGFLRCFPIVCQRINRKLVVKDGQHRLAVAEELQVPVSYIVEDVDFDIAEVNSTAKVWGVSDYVNRFIRAGKTEYQKAMDFCMTHKLPIGIGFAMLAGRSKFSSIQSEFQDGRYRISDSDWANVVATVYTSLVGLSRDVRNVRFIEACMSAARVEGFEPIRVIEGAKKCREKLVSYSTRDAYLELIEELYNFSRRKNLPIKFMAIEAAKKRNPAKNRKKK